MTPNLLKNNFNLIATYIKNEVFKRKITDFGNPMLFLPLEFGVYLPKLCPVLGTNTIICLLIEKKELQKSEFLKF